MLVYFLFEFLLVLGVVVIVPRVSDWRPRTFRRLCKLLETRPWLATCLLATFSIAVNARLSAVQPPAPGAHDEFSYLLAADTFAQGRLTNPTHPLWEHFESFHIIHQPTYSSKYPPGQGLMLALGQVLTGRPIVGSWIGVALMVAAVSWMLQGWLPVRWALFGSLIACTNAGLYMFWGQSYWGGQLPLAGAALALGGVPRLVKSQKIRDAVVMAIGVSILAVTRPYEGVIFTALVGIATLWQLYRAKVPLLETMARVVLPAAGVLLVTLSGLLYYNKQVTGDFKTFPYMVHNQQYEQSPLLLWQNVKTYSKTYRHRAMQEFHEVRMKTMFERQRDWADFWRIKLDSLGFIWVQFFSFGLLIPLLFVGRPKPLRKSWPLFAAIGVLFAGILIIPWLQSHYLATLAPFLLLILLEGMRRIRAGWQGRGRGVLAGLMITYLAFSAFRVTLYAAMENNQWNQQRARIARELEATGEEHLVVVRYQQDHDPSNEWVYNAADIDGSPIVWAREMGREHNRRLLEYYRDRRVWLLLADAQPPKLIEHKRPAAKPFKPPASQTAPPTDKKLVRAP